MQQTLFVIRFEVLLRIINLCNNQLTINCLYQASEIFTVDSVGRILNNIGEKSFQADQTTGHYVLQKAFD